MGQVGLPGVGGVDLLGGCGGPRAVWPVLGHPGSGSPGWPRSGNEAYRSHVVDVAGMESAPDVVGAAPEGPRGPRNTSSPAGVTTAEVPSCCLGGKWEKGHVPAPL